MSLMKGIKFRYLAAQLTKHEIGQFVNKLLDIDKDIIAKALFNILVDINDAENDNNINLDMLDNINNLISNIIQSRKKKPKPIPKQNMKLESIPKQLIGVISSFLPQNDYINFSNSNRFIFIGCNSPNLLQTLNINYVNNLSLVNLSLYPSIKCLIFDINRLNQLKGISKLNELTQLKLHAKQNAHLKYDIDTFMGNINTQNITQLSCINFGNAQFITTLFDPTQFIKLLSKFSNIEYLSFFNVACYFDTNEIQKLYPNLKGLKFSCKDRNKSLLTTFGNNMDYFWSAGAERSNIHYHMDAVNFGKLEELKLSRPNTKSITDILKTAINLKKIYIKATIRNKCCMKPEETLKLTADLLISCKLLQYIEFIDKKGTVIHEALNGIENGLFQTKELKREKLKIRIESKCKHISKSIITIAKIIHCLISSETNEFMLILYTPNCVNKCDNKCDNMIQDLNHNIFSNHLKKIQINQWKNEQVVITNIGCKINGYSETWKMRHDQNTMRLFLN